ncbi:hypothetical protein PAXRUDRAFT_823105 [Paxillus rubicundulus Ve08.2h10]|uniref:Uncharacterized protein n=1 Tax=Paxillus rubicundulus Ve08.2h10 TaxID=930991 RepID=A0A0D0DKT7_9AGAM|nr:hypothetical protein PAXRUDRAFT_823105 [Paxillus rubicundulus Ve08.2h10]
MVCRSILARYLHLDGAASSVSLRHYSNSGFCSLSLLQIAATRSARPAPVLASRKTVTCKSVSTEAEALRRLNRTYGTIPKLIHSFKFELGGDVYGP